MGGKTGCSSLEFRHLLVLSSSFCLIFTSYLAIQNLQTSLNDEGGLGIISLSAMYACIIISGILAPVVINVIGEKRVLVISFCCHCIFVASNFQPRFETLLPSSLLLGVTAGPMWTSQCVYLADKAVDYANQNQLDEHTTLSNFNGIFFAMYEITQITGNLISSLVLYQGTYNDTEVNVTLSCGKWDCPDVSYNTTSKIEKPERNIVYILMSVFLVIDVIGVLLTAFLLPPLQRRKESIKGNVKQALLACGKGLYKDLNLVLLIPLFMFMAMEQAVLLTDYTKAYITCPLGIQNIGYVMMTYGCSTTTFALTTSRLASVTGHRFLFFCAGTVNLATFVIMYVWSPGPDDIIYIFLLPALWGSAEGIWQTQSNALVAHLFPDETDDAFATYHASKATGFTITFIYSYFLCVSIKLTIAISLLIVSMVLYGIVEVRVARRDKQKTAEERREFPVETK